MQVDLRIACPIDVVFDSTSHADSTGCFERETVLTSEHRYRPELLRTEIIETNSLMEPFEVVPSQSSEVGWARIHSHTKQRH